MLSNSTAIRPTANPLRTFRMTWDAIAFSILAAAVLFSRLLHPAVMLGYFQDDFFYYLVVARNIAAHGTSTFNGLNLTNGYHPLWMVVLAVLCRFLHGTGFFFALQSVTLAAAISTYVLVRAILSLVSEGIFQRAGAFALGMASLMIMRYGMETTLTLPLATLFVWLLLQRGVPSSATHAASLGFLASFVILSRLDSGLLIALVCLAVLPRTKRSKRLIPVLAGFSAGVLPLLLVYFAVQWRMFHLLTPVSGLAKQLKLSHLPSAATWLSLVPSNRMKVIVVLPQLALLLLGLLSVPASRHRQTDTVCRSVALALVWFPFVHWTILSILSDWEMWPWYFYSLALGCLGALLLLASIAPARRLLIWYAAGYSVLLVLYNAAYMYQGPNSIEVLKSSRGLAAFMDQHPGVWMMGDQAGTTAYLSHQPIIQMEGLVMDRDFLEQLKAGEPLAEAVRRYHGDYYAFFGEPAPDGCFYLAEPTHAGPTSPKMLGKACVPPLASFPRENSSIKVIPARSIQLWR